MKTKLYTRGFVGGVISPSMVGRIDDAKRDSGLRTARNMIVLPEGVATSRPGTRFVRAAKNADKKARMITFRYSSTQTMALEFGETYIRFHTFGATLLTPTSGVSAWSAVPAYAQGDLVTNSGFTWYAVSAVPANQAPTTNEYVGGSPVVSATWVESVAASGTPPVGYTFVGSELPAVAVLAQQVYIQITTYVFSLVVIGYDGGIPIFEPTYVPVIEYVGYTGTAGGAGAGYWYKLGTYYEIPTPYAEADLMDLHYVQSGDVMTFVHPNYAPRELRRASATNWTLVPITFASALSAPAISAVTPTAAGSPSTTQTYSYVATNISADQSDESVQSAASTAVNQLLDSGAINTVTFAGAARRNVYRLSGGLYGFVGQTITTTLVDDNIEPDVSKTPPTHQNPFATDWPAAVTYFGQRRAFGGTTLLQQSFWLTKVGAESNLDYSIPLRDDDAIAVRIAAREASTIRHLVPLGDLLILTSSGEFSVSGGNGPITPLSVRSVPSTGYVGANNVQPVVVDDDLIYAAARGGHLRGMGYSFDRQRYASVDLSVRASHLFDFKTVKDMAFTRAPTPIVWSVSSDGKLVGLTYVPAEEVKAFHTHETTGFFESICSASEGDEDILYTVVRRTIEEATVRYIECFSPRFYDDIEDAYFVDCGITYNDVAATTISGLDHLIGETVAILADGGVVEPQVVNASGEIELVTEAEIVQVGLPLYREASTLPIAIESVEAFGQAEVKNINKVWVRLDYSGAFLAGPNTDSLQEMPARRAEAWGLPPDRRTEVVELTIKGEWNADGTLVMLSSDPTPLTIVSLTQEVEFGG